MNWVFILLIVIWIGLYSKFNAMAKTTGDKKIENFEETKTIQESSNQANIVMDRESILQVGHLCQSMVEQNAIPGNVYVADNTNVDKLIANNLMAESLASKENFTVTNKAYFDNISAYNFMVGDKRPVPLQGGRFHMYHTHHPDGCPDLHHDSGNNSCNPDDGNAKAFIVRKGNQTIPNNQGIPELLDETKLDTLNKIWK